MSWKKRIGVVLSGCGVKDGSEIHEAVLTLLAIDRAGARWVAFAPDAPQADVVDHVTGKAAPERRNVLAESARIARGEIEPLSKADPAKLDAVVLPGGFGAAKSLSDFASAGGACTVNGDLERLLRAMHKAGKPIGAWCIAPAILAAVFGKAGIKPRLTIGTDAGTANALNAMGALHEARPATGVVVDGRNRLVTTPCYMLAGSIAEVFDGVTAAIGEVLKLTEKVSAAKGK